MHEFSWILGSRSVDFHGVHDCGFQIAGFALVSAFLGSRSMASFGFWGPDSMVFMDFMFMASRFEDFYGFLRYWNTHSLIIIDFCSWTCN